ncbi:MAG: dephospho-CoA kinase [Neisseriaceae bacterium]|nr:MAG: dephospho-CoA kinase [Neisseriaceae bacterium]
MGHWVLITGGIGSGKTTVTNFFQQQGIPVIDTDVICRELTQVNGLAIDEIRLSFGHEAIDQNNALDRDWMRDKIFQDPLAKEKLENILHPIIFNQTIQLQKKIDHIYGLVVVPVFDKNSIYNGITERVLVVDVDQNIQVHRVIQRDHLTYEDVKRIIDAQISRTERLLLADDVIVNNQDQCYLAKQVLNMHKYYLSLFS